jgi:hypothetical protein
MLHTNDRGQAGLFSAVIASFIQVTSPLLQNGGSENIAAFPTVYINALFFSSLVVSLIAATVAMLVKQWARQYRMGLGDDILAWRLAQNRHSRYTGLRTSHLRDMVAWVPILLHLSLLLFLVGSSLWLYSMNKPTFVIITALISSGALIYAVLACAPVFHTESPYRWPISDIVLAIYHHLRSADGPSLEITEVELTNTALHGLLLTPDGAQTPFREQMMPTEVNNLDYGIMAYVLRHSDVWQEVEHALDNMRIFQIRGLRKGAAPTTLDGALILRRCRELADTCYIVDKLNRCVLVPDMLERARRVCRVLEWLYCHLNMQQRRTLSSWPSSRIAEALAWSSKGTTRFDDAALAVSVWSKLIHVSLAPGKPCRHCWTQDSSLWDRLRGQMPQGFSSDTQQWKHVQALVTSSVISDSECLLYYSMISTSVEYEDIIETAAHKRREMVLRFTQETPINYPNLKPYLLSEAKKLMSQTTRIHANTARTTVVLPWFRDLYNASWVPGEKEYDEREQIP